MNIYGYIYLVRNRINGKVYIGQTARTIEHRWKQHKKEARAVRSNAHLYCAMRKHGLESFDIVCLHQAFSKAELDDMERRAIFTHDSMNPDFGYNRTEGGANGKRSDETCKKLSESHMGHKRSDESRRKQSQSLMGHPSWSKGKKLTEATRQKMSDSQKGNTYCLGNKLTEAHRRKISDAVKGENHPNFGKKLSETTRQKMREARLRRKSEASPALIWGS
ncbi:NUMOD3 domain-containing DNA-binding protein [Granulicella mallensis]|uniref:Group I intron endonuclease n=1 Tax=Granulicella mallensis TaxID=940614 RepID=A0A7W8EC13_9BACT|nr:NUMOD3 domain-containing DNA-binding protein [Granulicella mallensis]MBB5066139.1 group I intron endonuclease [Granulicella mallensis]